MYRIDINFDDYKLSDIRNIEYEYDYEDYEVDNNAVDEEEEDEEEEDEEDEKEEEINEVKVDQKVLKPPLRYKYKLLQKPRPYLPRPDNTISGHDKTRPYHPRPAIYRVCQLTSLSVLVIDIKERLKWTMRKR